MEKKNKFWKLFLVVLLPFLLILTIVGPWLVQEIQQTYGIVPIYTYCSMLLMYGIIQMFVFHKYLDKEQRNTSLRQLYGFLSELFTMPALSLHFISFGSYNKG